MLISLYVLLIFPTVSKFDIKIRFGIETPYVLQTLQSGNRNCTKYRTLHLTLNPHTFFFVLNESLRPEIFLLLCDEDCRKVGK